MELDTNIHTPPPQAEHSLDVMVLGAQEHFLAALGLLGSFLLRAWARGMAVHAAGPRVLVHGRLLDAEAVQELREPHISVRGHRLDAKAAEALRELHRPRLEVGEAARGMV